MRVLSAFRPCLGQTVRSHSIEAYYYTTKVGIYQRLAVVQAMHENPVLEIGPQRLDLTRRDVLTGSGTPERQSPGTSTSEI